MAASPVELHIVSDATGETATRLVAALEAQFPEQPFEEIRHPRVETVDDLRLVVDRAKGRPAVVVYTIVKPELRDALRDFCRRAKLHYCDILGPPLASIAKVSGTGAQMKAGARPPLNSAYFKRMAAIEFAVKYDDVQGAMELREADIVLVGVSRTSKTPVSMFLGSMGYRTANVPIVKGIAPPEELYRIDPAKVVGLTIAAERLADIRRERARLMQAARQQYAGLVAIHEELAEAADIHRRLGCPVIDVTELSVEETATRIVRLVERRRQDLQANPS